jgi:hypothetical protein
LGEERCLSIAFRSDASAKQGIEKPFGDNRLRQKSIGNKKAALLTKRQKGANLFSKENTVEVLSLQEGINPRRRRWQ